MKSLNNLLEELLADESFLRWIRGKSHGREKTYWDSWLRENSDRSRLVHQAKKFLQLPYNSVEQPDIEIELEHLNKSIDQHTVVHKLDSYRSAKQKDRVRWLYGAVAVATAACVVLALLLFDSPDEITKDTATQYKTLVTSYGEKATLKLSDGTKIYVNAHSTLHYPQALEVNEPINVWLEGEAYFNVQRAPAGRERIFFVHTDDGEVQVLGTQFAVQTRNQKTQVVLEEGRVQVSLRDSIARSGKSLVMSPGEMSHFRAKSDTITVRQVNTDVYTSWIDDKIVMDETPLRDLVDRIEHTYGIEVRVEDKQILDHKLSGSLEEYNLAVLLEGLSQILETKIIHHEESVVIKNN